MKAKPDFVRERFAPLLERNLRNALAQRLRIEFPRLGGDRILNLCAQMILEIVETHLRPSEYVKHGQVVWMAVNLDDPPAYGKRISHTNLIPVLLNLSTPSDIDAIIIRKTPKERLLAKALRLCNETHAQGGLLSNCDLAELLTKHEGYISSLIAAYEREHNCVVPRRATLHDMGSGLTHKRIICWKYYAQGKSQDNVARETQHSLEAVGNYIGKFDRVRYCLQQSMTPEEIAFTLNCSINLVKQYIAINDEIVSYQRTNSTDGDQKND